MRKFVLVLISCIIGLLLGELLLKLFFPLEVKVNHQKIFCRYDSLLGWIKVPNYVGYHTTEEYNVKESFNSKGLRGNEYTYVKGANEKRILIFGDSFAEAYMVEFEDMFSEILKRILNNADSSGIKYYEVINFGTGGYSTDQEVLYFKSEGIKYNPDIVVLMFCVNDVWYNNQKEYWRGYKPMYELADGRLVLTNVPVPLPDSDEPALYTKLKDWLEDNSEIYKRICIVKDMITLALREEENKIPGDFLIYTKNPDKEVKYSWDLTEAIISDLKSACDSVGSDLIIFYVPSKEAIYDNIWQEIISTYKMTDDEYSVDQPLIRLDTICRRLGIHFIDPTREFAQEADKLTAENKLIYYKTDRHLNDIGNRLAGEIIARYIQNKDTE
jgi:lysophospholipase L1-like esterase